MPVTRMDRKTAVTRKVSSRGRVVHAGSDSDPQEYALIDVLPAPCVVFDRNDGQAARAVWRRRHALNADAIFVQARSQPLAERVVAHAADHCDFSAEASGGYGLIGPFAAGDL